jgi:hypothetical protein
MFRRSIAAVAALAFATLVAFAAPVTAVAATGGSTALTFPVNASSTAQGAFTGTLRITSFGVVNNALVASGMLTGTLIDETGARIAVARSVNVPVNLSGAALTKAAQAKAVSCDILHLELGPLDLDLLGLVVHLDKVVLDLWAAPGAGNLLGNLLCSVTNLLNGPGALAQIANLLNQILDLLG